MSLPSMGIDQTRIKYRRDYANLNIGDGHPGAQPGRFAVSQSRRCQKEEELITQILNSGSPNKEMSPTFESNI